MKEKKKRKKEVRAIAPKKENSNKARVIHQMVGSPFAVGRKVCTQQGRLHTVRNDHNNGGPERIHQGFISRSELQLKG